ncbi:MAG: UpxY family transcription antiterminator [Prevotella sp.]|nr:UpxY family transcription antiterminator [Prevotella sp.]
MLSWFPMRVTYSQELKVKASLDAEGIENFLPMTYKLVDRDGERHRSLVPAIHNLIFVHSTQERITQLKMFNRAFSSLRYIMNSFPSGSSRPEILTVRDSDMENFIRVASVADDSVVFLDWSTVADKVSRRVMVMDGPFAGVSGVIMRIRRNKHVVVQLEGIAAVAITFIPPAFLKLQDDNKR